MRGERRGKRLRAAGIGAIGVLCLAAGGVAAGQAPADHGARAAVLSGLVDCRKIVENAARLACYDHAVESLDHAEREGEVTVIDRAQAKAMRRQAFGFELPSLSFLSRGAGAKDEGVDRVSVTVDHAAQDRNGRWRFVTDDGAVWMQVDDEGLSNDPHKGSVIAIRKAALGSYFCNVDGQRALRCLRQH